MNYSVLEAYKLGPRIESSKRNESHSYDNGNYPQGIQKTLESVFGGALTMIPSKS
jgi:hypothetical protein